MRRFLSRVVDNNGSLVSAASVAVYLAGTSTLATLYSGEAAGETPTVLLANPFKSDHQGVFEFYTQSGDYDIDVTDPMTGFARRFFDVTIQDSRDVNVLKSGDTMVGSLLFSPDNTLDLGSSSTGTLRPRTGYYGTSLVTPLLQSPNVDLILEALGTTNLLLKTSGFSRWEVASAGGHILPLIDSTYDMGSSTNKLRDIFPGRSVQINAGATLGPVQNLIANPPAKTHLFVQAQPPITDLDRYWGGTFQVFVGTVVTGSGPAADNKVALYAAVRRDSLRSSAVWAINTVTEIVTGIGTYGATGYEVDFNNNHQDAVLGASILANGVDIVSGGTFKPLTALSIRAGAGNKWRTGIDLPDTGFNDIGIRVGAAAFQTPSSINARQLSNGADTIFLQRFTDTAPTGYLLRLVNAANSGSLVYVSASGDLVSVGILQTSAFIITPTIGPAGGQQHTLPAVASDTIALLAAVQTLTNKTLNGPLNLGGTRTTQSAITVGASPFTYTNNDNAVQTVYVLGGTVSQIVFTRNATNTTITTLNADNPFIMSPGDALQVTYTVAPTMVKVFF